MPRTTAPLELLRPRSNNRRCQWAEHRVSSNDLYFTRDEETILVPLTELVPRKPPESQPESVDRAAERMAAAAVGKLERRAPITVRRLGADRWDVLDGNATYGVALREGWTALPAKVERR